MAPQPNSARPQQAYGYSQQNTHQASHHSMPNRVPSGGAVPYRNGPLAGYAPNPDVGQQREYGPPAYAQAPHSQAMSAAPPHQQQQQQLLQQQQQHQQPYAAPYPNQASMDPQAYNVRQPSGPVPVTAAKPKTQLIVGIDFVSTNEYLAIVASRLMRSGNHIFGCGICADYRTRNKRGHHR